jgi:hypothetical protein
MAIVNRNKILPRFKEAYAIPSLTVCHLGPPGVIVIRRRKDLNGNPFNCDSFDRPPLVVRDGTVNTAAVTGSNTGICHPLMADNSGHACCDSYDGRETEAVDVDASWRALFGNGWEFALDQPEYRQQGSSEQEEHPQQRNDAAD